MVAIKSAFSSYTKNIGGYFLSTIVHLIWMLVAVGLPFGLFALSTLAVGAYASGDIATTLISNPLLAIVFLGWMLIISILFLFFVASGTGAYINACFSIASGKVPTMLGNIEYGIKNGGRFLALILILFIIYGIFFIPALLSFFLLKNNIALIVLLLAGLAGSTLMKFLFMFAFPSSVIDRMTPLGSMSRSLRLVLKNLVQCIIFAVLLTVISMVLGLIPLVNVFVLLPFVFITLSLFYKSLN